MTIDALLIATGMVTVCSAEKPAKGRADANVVLHVDAVELGRRLNNRPHCRPGDELVAYSCPNCGHSWEMETGIAPDEGVKP